MQIYQVGGALRDKILGIKATDTDYVVVGATEDELLKAGYKRVGKSFPVFLHPTTGEEYALARKEVKTGAKHTDFKFIFTPDITLKEDSLRRDFTCNALYQDIKTGEIIDYHNGINDIKNKVLRHVSEHFVEDPLRILRMCRFAAQLDFTIAPETMELCKKMVKEGALKHLSATRIWQEMKKAMSYTTFYKFISTARECGVLEELLPEIEVLWDIPERPDYHPEKNSGEHTLLAVKAAHTTDSFVNFAVLCHDIGKSKTDKTLWPSHKKHETLGAELLPTIIHRLNVPNNYKDFTLFAVRNHMIYHKKIAEVQTEIANIVVTLAHHQKEDYIERFIAVLRADMHGRALDDFTKEEREFTIFETYLRQMYQTAITYKVSDIPEFEKIKEQVDKGNISPQVLREKYLNMLISKNSFPCVKNI